jgi:hypothetical protein
MKCIKAIKPTKHVAVGEIKRVADSSAEISVKDGYWQYVSKSEWKTYSRKQANEPVVETVNESIDNNKKSKNK